eukprot:CAMPEP_0183313736 /NCGR_PEP_ID=MMETSP0160_2-20130417/46363_1 /TAXON_ID=2839 ORGANISM="Odontella Sinensis, Strain Grunow 1884" /NCGR_SAMPLE_ID=MMETSP0160_2 /ASSEMBLY_ACC=CAM_ASM_000250 /LENGTH=166 /DNA_ID=CAMNT_0025478881 /DNA_START=71 /DNA_END=571 /DNA_ORIENTATION=-
MGAEEGDKKTVILVSKDGERMTVPAPAAVMSGLIRTTIEDVEDDDDVVPEIPLPNVESAVLAKVVEFCVHHQSDPMQHIEKPLRSNVMAEVVQRWYADFINVDQAELYELTMAANFMDVKPLLDLACAAAACALLGRSREDIRRLYNAVNGFHGAEGGDRVGGGDE